MKPLIKHEFRRILVPGIILSIISFIVYGITLGANINSAAEAYVMGRYVSLFMDIFLETYPIALICSGAIIIWLVYCQFQEDKVEGTGDFIATLPYTQQENFINKVLVGSITIITSLVIGLIITYVLFNSYEYYAEYTYSREAFGDDIRNASGFINIVGIMINGYLGLLICYLFLVVAQYSIYNTIGATVIAVLSVASIPYMLIGLYGYVEETINLGTEIFEPIVEVLEVILMCAVPIQSKYIEYQDGGKFYVANALGYNYPIDLFVLICIAIILFIVGKMLAQKYGLRNRKTFMINKVVEYIFKIGVTVCSALIPFVFANVFLGVSSDEMFIVTLFMILTGVVGCIISHKITAKGRE